MKNPLWKPVVTYTLLAFAAVSLIYAVAQEVRHAPSASAQELRAAPSGTAGLEALKGGRGKAQAAVYYATYYHGNVRCPTCKKIEAYSKEAVETRFATEIKAGKVAFRMINYDEKGNEHYKKDYALEAQSLIVSEVKGGKEQRWLNLPKVWDLTHDKAKFIQYVEDEFRAFIKIQGKTTAAVDGEAASSTGTVANADSGAAAAAAVPGAAEHRIIAYYLHGDTRCPSCIKIESYADAAVHERFAPELESGQLEWRVVNYDEPDNRHYWQDFQLEVKTVVLEDMENGEQVRYKRLDRVWDLLDDEQAFAAYIEEETRRYLEGV